MSAVKYFQSLEAARTDLRLYTPRAFSAQRMRGLFARPRRSSATQPRPACRKFRSFDDARQHALEFAIAQACERTPL